MTGYLARRIVGLGLVLFSVVSITFFLARLQPGGPFDKEKNPPAFVKEELLRRYDLDGSLWSQYTRYMGDLIRGDLRVSFEYRNWSVGEVIGQQLPVSLQLGGVAFILATSLGTLLGCLAAMRKDTWIDRAAMLSALLAISLPSFITGPLLIGVFALTLGWFPVGGWGGLRSIILPALCLAAPYVAYIARLMRNSMLEVLGADYIRTARAKGLTPFGIGGRHALKVALLPVVTFLGPLAAHLLTGSIVVESVFSIPGAGSIFVNSIQNRDTFLLCGVVILYCTLLVLFNLAVDLAYCALDPRIQFSHRNRG
jgi:oligopeptide transport system permease protein